MEFSPTILTRFFAYKRNDQATTDATSQTMCETGYSLASRKMEIDISGQNPARIDSQYSHFHTSADFAQKKMTVRVKI